MKFLSALVTQGSGVIGNLVVEKNGVIRNRNNPANPRSAFQQGVRTVLTFLAQAWSGILTPTQRTNWNAYAATVTKNDVLGKAVKLTGIDMYVAGNSAGSQAGLSRFDDAPVTTGVLALPSVASVVIDDSANTAVVTFTDTVPLTTHVNFSLSTGSLSLGISKFSGPFRFNQSQVGAGTNVVTFTGVTLPAAGEQWGWRVIGVDEEGRVSRRESGLTIAVA